MMEVVFSNKANVLNTKLMTAHDGAVIYTVETTQHSLFGGREATYLKDMNPCTGTTRRRSIRQPWLRAQGRGRETGRSGKDDEVLVGLINWKKKIIEVGGSRRSIDDVRRKVSGKVVSLSMALGNDSTTDSMGEGSSVEPKERGGFPGLASLRLPSFKLGKGPKKSEVWQWNEGHDAYEFVHHDQGWQIYNKSSSDLSGTMKVPYRPHLFQKPKPVELELSREALRKDEVFLLLVLIYLETKRQEKTNHVASAGW